MTLGVGIIGAVGRAEVPSTTDSHPVFDPDAGIGQFYGVLDDVRQFNTPEADDVVLDRALVEMDPTDPSLVFYLKFSEGTGTDAFDSTAAAIDATLSTSALWAALDGGSELRGQRKRRAWGRRRQVAGTLIDRQRLVYQVNAADTEAIVPTQGGYPTFDPPGGVSTYDGDFPSIYDWTPASGHYATQLSEGLVRFHSDPTAGGTVVLAFDVDGTVDPEHGWSATAAHIMRDLVVNAGELSEIDEVDTGAVTEHAAARPDDVGVVTGTEPVSVSSLLTSLVQTGDGWWTFLRDGRWTLGVREEPAAAEVILTPNMVQEQGIRRIASPPPAYRQRLSYRPYDVTVPLDQVNIAVDEVDRGQFGEEVRYYATAIDTAVRTRFGRIARLAEGTTLYDLESAVKAEAARRQALDRLKREVYQVPLMRGLLQFRIGQVVGLYLADDRLLLGRRRVTANRSGYRFIDFDGSTGWVSVPSPPAVGSASFTLEGWLRVDVDSPSGGYFIAGRGTGTNGWWWLELQTPSLAWGYLKLHARPDLGGPPWIPSTLTSSEPITLASGWTHFAMVVDRDEDVVRFVINGVLDSEHAWAVSGSVDSAGGDMSIGSAAGASSFFNGAMSDLRLWPGVARTVEEIAADMDDYVEVSGGGGNWRFNDGNGSAVAADAAGAADGVVHPTVSWGSVPALYRVRNFAVGGYDEDSESEKAVLYLWGLAGSETEFAQ